MPDGTAVIFLYDDTFDGLMSAVYASYAYRPAPEAVTGRAHCQQLLGRSYVDIATDEATAARVVAGVRRAMGEEAVEKIWRAFLSDGEDKGTAIYRYIRLGMRVGRAVHQHLTDPRVIAVNKLDALVGREVGLLIEFTRFAKLEGGVYYGEITPEHDVLTLLMPHFIDRFHVQPFILHDKGRRLAAVFDRREWVLTSTETMQLPAYAADEQAWRRMWKTFYDTIAIKERINPALRRNHMPKKYWKNMLEMQPDLPGQADPAPATIPAIGEG